MSQPTTSPTPLAHHVPCMTCTYDLYNLPHTANCPECNTPIQNSIWHFTLTDDIHPRHFRAIRQGAVCLGIATLLAPSAILFGILIEPPFAAVAFYSACLLLTFAAFRFAIPNRRPDAPLRDRFAASLAKYLALPAAAIPLLLFLNTSGTRHHELPVALSLAFYILALDAVLLQARTLRYRLLGRRHALDEWSPVLFLLATQSPILLAILLELTAPKAQPPEDIMFAFAALASASAVAHLIIHLLLPFLARSLYRTIPHHPLQDHP